MEFSRSCHISATGNKAGCGPTLRGRHRDPTSSHLPRSSRTVHSPARCVCAGRAAPAGAFSPAADAGSRTGASAPAGARSASASADVGARRARASTAARGRADALSAKVPSSSLGVGTTPAANMGTPSGGTALFTTLNLLRDKGLISQAEYDSAVKDMLDTLGMKAGDRVDPADRQVRSDDLRVCRGRLHLGFDAIADRHPGGAAHRPWRDVCRRPLPLSVQPPELEARLPLQGARVQRHPRERVASRATSTSRPSRSATMARRISRARRGFFTNPVFRMRHITERSRTRSSTFSSARHGTSSAGRTPTSRTASRPRACRASSTRGRCSSGCRKTIKNEDFRVRRRGRREPPRAARFGPRPSSRAGSTSPTTNGRPFRPELDGDEHLAVLGRRHRGPPALRGQQFRTEAELKQRPHDRRDCSRRPSSRSSRRRGG